jgi:two-component system LytT family response regulator
MPNLSGFEVLKRLEPVKFEVIFVTAFNEHALEAFDYQAIGYITKPIHPERLMKAVQAAQEKIQLKKTTENIFTLLQNKLSETSDSQMALATMHGMIFIQQEDIVYCESNRNCTNFYTNQGKKLVVTKQIGEYERLLTDTHFVRIHDKYIINLKYASEYIKGRGGEIKLKNDIILPVSVGRKDNLLAHFERWLKR